MHLTTSQADFLTSLKELVYTRTVRPVTDKERDLIPMLKDEKSRAATLKETRNAKIDRLFGGTQYTVTGEVHLEGTDRFVTPLGNKGRNGFRLLDASTNSEIIVGATVLRIAAAKYRQSLLCDESHKAAYRIITSAV